MEGREHEVEDRNEQLRVEARGGGGGGLMLYRFSSLLVHSSGVGMDGFVLGNG